MTTQSGESRPITETIEGSNRTDGLPGNRRLKTIILPLLLIAGLVVLLNFALRASFAPAESFTNFELPYTQTFDEVAINRWFSHNGQWGLQNGALVQKAESVSSAQLFVPYRLAETDRYRLSVQVQLSPTTRAAGLNFNAQYPDIAAQHQRAYVVREPDGLRLVTGYLEPEGEFLATTLRAIPQIGESFTLAVVVEADVYHVEINGRTMIENRPLTYRGGLVGLYTTDGPVTFDNLLLSELDSTYRAAAALTGDDGLLYRSDFGGQSGSAGWVPFEGDWQIRNGALAQLDPGGYDFGIGFESERFSNFVLQAAFSHLSGRGAGVLFNMPSPYQTAGAHIVRYSDRSDNLFWGYFNEAGVFNFQGYAPVASPGTNEHVLTVTADGQNYAIALDGEIIAESVPLITREGSPEGGYIGLLTARSTAAWRQVEVTMPGAETVIPQPAPRPTAGPVSGGSTAVVGVAGTVTVGEPFDYAISGTLVDPNAAAGWVPISGQWVVRGDTLLQTTATGYDMAASYAGSAFRNYTLNVTLRHLSGNGGGVLFNMASPDTLEGAHMVRYSDRTPGGVFWGYYDATGKFIGQGYARLNPPGNGDHTFSIISGDSGYTIVLDGQILARNVGTNRNNGHFGLIAAQSQVGFGPVEISGGTIATGTATTGTVTDGTVAVVPPGVVVSPGVVNTTDLQPLSGDWERNGTTITQTNSSIYDFINSTATYAGTYTLEVGITLPDDPDLADAGGGIVFHMPERNQRAGASMARLTGPQSVIWGYYDATGAFVGRGRATLTEAAQSHVLVLQVKDGRYDLLVNGEVIATDIPLANEEGWIGLLAHRGPVTFENIRITLGS